MVVIAVVILFCVDNQNTSVKANSTNRDATPIPTSTSSTQQEGTDHAVSAQEQASLKSAINAYFEMHYQARSAAQPEGFQVSSLGSLLATSANAQTFWQEERSKLAVELKNAQLNRIRYVNYTYSLKFLSITIDASGQKATIRLSEGNEVIYEISRELNPVKPIDAVHHT